jgi:hypothetical protein
MERFGEDCGMEKALLLKFSFLEMKHHGQEKQRFTGIRQIIFLVPN